LSFCREILQQRKQAGDLEDRGDLLSMFIQFGRKTNQPNLLTDEYLKDVIINFMVAGRDTTASTLTHMFRALSEDHRIRDKLTKSLEGVQLCGDVKSDVETLYGQEYMRQVMTETLAIIQPCILCPAMR